MSQSEYGDTLGVLVVSSLENGAQCQAIGYFSHCDDGRTLQVGG